MKVLLAIVLAILFSFSAAFPVRAGDLADGAKVFSANCAACHNGGGNVVNGSKTLKKEALEKYDMASLESIKYQVVHGKNAMPAFKGRLSDQQIEDVAAYVLDKSEQGW